LISADGTIYEGEFNQNTKEGKGKEILPDGSHFEGTFWENGWNKGTGVKIYADGKRFEG